MTMQQSVGSGIADGTDGKEDRAIDLLDLLGYQPVTPLMDSVAGSQHDRIANEYQNNSFMGSAWPFKKVTGMFGCIGNSTSAIN